MMIIYNYNPENGYFVGTSQADESPLEPGIYLLPAHSTTVKAPEFNDGQIPIFDGSKWTIIDLPIEEVVTISEEEIQAKKEAKAALLAKLGISEEEAKLLLS